MTSVFDRTILFQMCLTVFKLLHVEDQEVGDSSVLGEGHLESRLGGGNALL